MKKFLSLFLTILMVLSIASVGFAKSPIGVSAEGWNGWSGNATTETNPITASGTVVKVNGTAVLDPAMRFEGVMELTAEVYAPQGGTISLKNSKGQSAATHTLTEGAEGWSTYKLFVMAGAKSYQVYTTAGGVDTFVCDGTVDNIVAPTKIEFTGTDMYVGKVTLNEMEKARPYPDSELTPMYTMDLSKIDGVVKGENDGNGNWLNNQTEENTLVKNEVTYQSRSSFEKVTFNGVDAIRAKNTGANEEGVTYTTESNTITKYITISGNLVYDMKLYIPGTVNGETNKAELLLQTRDTSGLNLVRLNAEEGISASPVFSYDRHIDLPKDDWFDLKLEILREMQGMNIYIDGVKMNGWVIELDNTDGLGTLTRFPMALTNTQEAAGEIYFRDVKLSQTKSAGELVEKEVFSENFDSDTSELVYTVGASTYTNPNYKRTIYTSNATNAAGKTGLGKFHGTNTTKSTCTHYLESTEGWIQQDPDFTYKAAKYIHDDGRYYNESKMDLSDAENVNIRFKFYNAGVSSYENGVADCLNLWVTKNVTDTAESIATPRVYIYRDDYVGTFHKGTELSKSSGRIATGTARVWSDAELTIAPNSYSLTVDGTTASFTPELSIEEIRELGYINFDIGQMTGGIFYLDDLSVTKSVTAPADYVMGYYEPSEQRSFESDLTRAEIKELEYAEVRFTDGRHVCGVPCDDRIIDRVTIKENRGVAEDAKVIVAVYEGDALKAAAILDYDASGIYDIADKNIAVNEESRVRVFYWSMGALNPIDTFDAIDKNTARPSLWVLGDSTAAHYSPNETTKQEGWGDYLNEFLNSNEINVRNEAIPGEAVKRLVDSSGTSGSLYDKLLGENGEVKRGDYVLISFGINDAKSGSDGVGRYATPYGSTEGTWQWYVGEKLIKVIRDKGAIPILVTENPKYNFEAVKDSSGNVIEEFAQQGREREYVRAMDAIAAEEQVSLVDLNGMYLDYLDGIGSENAKGDFCFADDGVDFDGTHPNALGSRTRAGFICKGLKLLGIEGLSEYIK